MQQSRQVALDASWPGLDEPSGLAVDPEALEVTAGLIRAELDDRPAASPEDLKQQLSFGQCQAFGGWDTALWMEHGLRVAGESIACYYGKVLEQGYAAAALFEATAEDYREQDLAVRARLQGGWEQIAAGTDGVGPAGPAAGLFRETTPVQYINFYEDTERYDADWIQREMSRLESGQAWRPVAEVGRSLELVAGHLDELATVVRSRAEVLAQEWSSDTSVACQRALRRIAGTAAEIGECARRSSEFAFESAETLQRAVQGKGFEDGRGFWGKFGDFFQEGDPRLAEQLRAELGALNEAYRTTNLRLPPYVNANLPELPDAEQDRRGPTDGGGGSGSSTGGYSPPSPPPAPGSTASPDNSMGRFAAPSSGTPAVLGPGELGPGSGFAGGGVPGDAAGSSGAGDLPSGGLAGVGGGAPAGVGPGGLAPGAGVPGAGPGMSPGGVGAPGAGVLGTGGAGAGVVPGAAAGAGLVPGRGGVGMVPMGAGQGAGGGSGGRSGGRPGLRVGGSGGSSGMTGGGPPGPGGGAGAGRAGASGMAPLTGAGRSNAEEQAKGPEAWLLEDEDPWRGDDRGIPPPVIK